MPPSTDRPTPALASPPAEFRFDSWPLRDEAVSACILLVSSALMSTLAGYLSYGLPMGLICFAAFALALWRLWMPIRYIVGPRGVSETVFGRERRIPWSQIARFEIRRRGVLLHATHEPTPLRVFQARYIPWGRRRIELLEIVRYYLDR